MLKAFQISCFCTHPLFRMKKKMQYTKLRSPRVLKKTDCNGPATFQLPWQNIQREDKLLCEETGRGWNDSKLWDMEPHRTRSPALIHPRLVVPESLSKLSSLPEYLKELMAPAQQIPVGRDLAQHAPGMWTATHLLQNLPNTRRFFPMIIVFTGRPSSCLHSNCVLSVELC